jgi:hypothetical protein
MSTNSKDEEELAKLEIKNIAKEIVQGKVDLLKGIRKLHKLRYKVPEYQDLLLPIVGIESETDIYPLDKERESCSPELLARLDSQKENYFSRVKPTIFGICEQLISNAQ